MNKFKLSDVIKKTRLTYEELTNKLQEIGKSVSGENDEFSEDELKSIGIDVRILSLDKRQELVKQALERRKRNAKSTEVVIKETQDVSKKLMSRDEVLKKKMELNKSIQQLDSEREKQRIAEKQKAEELVQAQSVKMEDESSISKNTTEKDTVKVEEPTDVTQPLLEENRPKEQPAQPQTQHIGEPEKDNTQHAARPKSAQEETARRPYQGKKPWQDRKPGQQRQSSHPGTQGASNRRNERDQQNSQQRAPAGHERGRQDEQRGQRPPYGASQQPGTSQREQGYRGDRPKQYGERQGFDRTKKPESRGRGEFAEGIKEKSVLPPVSESLLDEKEIIARKKKWEDEGRVEKEEVEVKKIKVKKTVVKKDKNLKKDILESLDELDLEASLPHETPVEVEEAAPVEISRPKSIKVSRNQKEKEEEQVVQKPQKPNRIQIGESITISELAGLLGVRIPEIIKKLMTMGIMAHANQSIDAETVQLIAIDYGIEVEVKSISEEDLIPKYEDKPEMMKPRPPIVTVMGHVDHGKTSLLDAIRKTKVAEKEAGGITQHIGAYEVEIDRGKIVFLDTPGHEAFTTLRARGANVTDIVVLVVAADDGVMPQTKEAIDHARAAGVRIIVAVNKIDKPNANPEKVKTQLAEYGIIPEEWGGEYQFQEISAKNRIGIDDLLERIIIEAEMLELKSNYERPAEGIIIESRLDKQKGVTVSLIVRNGVLKIGDFFVAGVHYGKVRAMFNYLGKSIKEAGPSTPVELIGFSEVPEPGETFLVMPNEKTAKQIVDLRLQRQRERDEAKRSKVMLDDIFSKIKEGEIKDLNIILKADVQGSLEALKASLQKLTNQEVKVNIIHDGVGGINESDVLLALASKAIIIGFNVRPDVKAKTVAEREKVDIRLYSVIYEAIDEVQKAIEGMLTPEIKEHIIGKVEVRKVFSVPKIGKVAGCYVLEGKVARNSNVRVIRDNIVVYTGKINSLKRFQEDVKEVVGGYECGLGIANYNDIRENDILEVFEMQEEKRLLKDVEY